ncbi:GH32 C-terminal domain-containing protein [Corynebacterium halotolerans]|uniref:GH32 C-terminal domain-containing protein n=1 Tax=Corynebacterium halotolerans TaxID=225326 RepID=UPI003CF0BE9A
MATIPHRPELHVTPEAGVLDAPAGALLDGDTWHIFHQYRPTPNSPARLAHQVSAGSPFEWDTCEDVLAPQGNETLVRAGSVVPADHGVNIYFTSVTESGTSVHLAHIADLIETTTDVSDDDYAVDPHVRRVGEVVGDRDGFHDFRSPCVVPGWVTDDDRSEGHRGWLMLSVTGEQTAPKLVLLKSDNGYDWQVLGPVNFRGHTGLDFDKPLVSPRLIRLRDEVDGEIYDILMVTVENEGIDISGYLVGRFHGADFEVRTAFSRIDFGHDFTRPRITNSTPGTVPADQRYHSGSLFGLMNGIGRFDEASDHPSLQLEGWANCISLPRIITLQEGLIYQTPPMGLPDQIPETSGAASWTGLCEIPTGSSLQVEIIDETGDVAAVVTHQGDILSVDRSMNRYHVGDHVAQAPLAEGDTDSLSLFVDGSTLEVFADGGAIAMASRVYLDGSCREFRVRTEGQAEIIRSYERFPRNFDSSALPDYEENEFGEDDVDEGPVR